MNWMYIKAIFKTLFDTDIMIWYSALDEEGYAVIWAVLYHNNNVNRVIRADKSFLNELFSEMVSYGIPLNLIYKEYSNWLCHATECKLYASRLTSLCTERIENENYVLDVPDGDTYTAGYVDLSEWN